MKKTIAFCDVYGTQLREDQVVTIKIPVGYQDDPADGHRSTVHETIDLSPWAAQWVLERFIKPLSREAGAGLVAEIREKSSQLKR